MIQIVPNTLVSVVIGFGCFVVVTVELHRGFQPSAWWPTITSVNATVGALLFLQGNVWGAINMWIMGAVYLWVWWHIRRRGRRKRVSKLIGAKAKALRARLVRRQRAALRPRNVLNPGVG